MELNCDPCDKVHKVTQGQAEKIIYALMIERADAKAYGVEAATGHKFRNPNVFMACPEDLLQMAEYRSEHGVEVDEMVLRRQNRADRKRRAEVNGK